MPRLIILLSGRICTGKTTLAERLVNQYGFRCFSTRELLGARLKSGQEDRRVLQRFGEELDSKTHGAWLRDDLAESIRELPDDAAVVIDSVRVRDQIERFRESYRPLVVHVHLDCDNRVLAQRYKRKRKRRIKELRSFAETAENRTEAAVPELEREADISIRTDYSRADDVMIRVACLLGLHGREHFQYVDVIIGGQFGSEGKGQIAAYLAPEYDLLVRVGGPNAGHKVYEDAAPYTFHQLPSGTRCSNARLLIGAGAALRTDVLLREIQDSKVDPDRLAIDPHAIIITAEDARWEKKGLRRTIGSTAQGTGRAAIRRILRGADTLFAKDVRELKPFIRPAVDVLEEARMKKEKVMLEGTQGTGLSLFHGHYPFVTSRDTTVAGCISESGIPPRAVRRVIMVCRTFPIRVQSPTGGTSGPMTQEISLSELARRSGIAVAELRKTERTSTTNRRRRIAEFDWQQLRRSAQLNAPTDIAITFADYIAKENRAAHRFDQLTPPTLLFMSEVEQVACAHVSLVSVGFNHRAVLDRRSW
jgi:adenylosuccinate synthase